MFFDTVLFQLAFAFGVLVALALILGRTRKGAAVLVIAFSPLVTGATASPLVFDRGLPSANLNSGAGADRSNVGWDFLGFGFFAGDDFAIAGGGTTFVDTIKIWAYPDSGGAASANNDGDIGNDGSWKWGDTYSSLGFYLGPTSVTDVPLLAGANFLGAGSNATDNPNVALERVQFPGGGPEFDYQGSSGSYLQLYEITFSNLGIALERGTSYQFGLECRGPSDTDNGTPDVFTDDTFTLCFAHASNRDLAGTPQDGSDNFYRYFFTDALAGPATAGGLLDSNGFGWDKSSDVGIQIFGTNIPEPASLTLFGAGLAGIVAFRRRGTKKAA